MSTSTLIVLFATAALVAVGVVAVLVTRFRRAGIDMTMLEFLRRLLGARGHRRISAARLEAMLAEPGDEETLVVDLRSPDKRQESHIGGSLSRWFDDFLRDVLVEGRHVDRKDLPVVLVCDTGHMSRVAADVLVRELGFSRVYDLRGGMAAWNRHRLQARRRLCCLPQPATT